MKYVRVLADAWGLTTTTKKLTWFVFVPSVAFILLSIGEVLWQYVLFGEEFGWIEHGSMYAFIKNALATVHSAGMMWLLITVVIMGALLLFVLKPWIDATLILSIQQRFTDPEKRLSLRHQITCGHKYFISLLEYHALLAPFALLSILFYTVAFYRYTHGSDTYFQIFLPLLIILSAISLVVHFFLVFTPFYIVNEEGELFKSLTNSMGLVFRHFGKTLALFLVMILVSLRIIVNVIVIVGIPLGLIALATYFAASSYYTFFVFLAVILSIVLVTGTSYLTAVLEVFSTAFWYRGFCVFKAMETESSSTESASIVEEQGIQPVETQQPVKVVHVVHHIRPGDPIPRPEDFTDITEETIVSDTPKKIGFPGEDTLDYPS